MHSRKRRILVVDDDPFSAKTVRRVLEGGGFDVLVASDGPSGLDEALQAKPDVITLDINMPGLDGYEVCRRLQAHPDTASIPVLMLTGLGQLDGTDDELIKGVDQRIEGYDAGAVEFLSKPVRAEELLHRVEGLLWLTGPEV